MSYVSNIANSILSHAHNAAVLGPEIYTAIAEWEKREIPVAIVLNSIEEVCSHGPQESADRVRVDLFEDAVVRNFRTWLAQGNDQPMNV